MVLWDCLYGQLFYSVCMISIKGEYVDADISHGRANQEQPSQVPLE